MPVKLLILGRKSSATKEGKEERLRSKKFHLLQNIKQLLVPNLRLQLAVRTIEIQSFLCLKVKSCDLNQKAIGCRFACQNPDAFGTVLLRRRGGRFLSPPPPLAAKHKEQSDWKTSKSSPSSETSLKRLLSSSSSSCSRQIISCIDTENWRLC